MTHSPIRRLGWKFYGGLFILSLGAFALFCASLAQGPDLTLHFAREVPSDVPPAVLGKAVTNLINWPNWFNDVAEVKALNYLGQPYSMKDQVAQTGSILKIEVDPKKGKWKRFELTAMIVEYVPYRMIHLKVLGDSQGKLNSFFDQLEWRIEIEPRAAGSLIRGIELAHTHHWRARLFGKLTERILMNQLFYPDLIKLAELKQPLDVNPLPPTQQ